MNSYHDHNIRGHTISVVVFAFFAGGAFIACIAAVFLASFPLRLDGFFPAPPGFVGLANGAADSSESDNEGGTADARAMGAATAAAEAGAGDVDALAAALVERLRVGLSPTAGSVAFGEAFLAMTDV